MHKYRTMVRRILDDRRWPMSRLAYRLGVDVRTVKNWVMGRNLPYPRFRTVLEVLDKEEL